MNCFYMCFSALTVAPSIARAAPVSKARPVGLLPLGHGINCSISGVQFRPEQSTHGSRLPFRIAICWAGPLSRGCVSRFSRGHSNILWRDQKWLGLQ
jgi:hypothetical protein